VKVILMTQLAEGAREVPQLLVCAKSVLWAPVTAMLVMASTAVPVLSGLPAVPGWSFPSLDCQTPR
jgi:hypothetical protein